MAESDWNSKFGRPCQILTEIICWRGCFVFFRYWPPEYTDPFKRWIRAPAELNKVLQHNSATVSRAKAKRWVRESRRKWHALRCEQTPHFIQLWPQWAQRRAVLISLSKYLNNIPTNFYIESGSNPLVISLTKSQTTIPTITIYHNCQRNDLIWFIFKESASADQSGSLEFDINWKNNISERGKFSAF